MGDLVIELLHPAQGVGVQGLSLGLGLGLGNLVIELLDGGVLAQNEHAGQEDHERHQVVVVRAPLRVSE